MNKSPRTIVNVLLVVLTVTVVVALYVNTRLSQQSSDSSEENNMTIDPSLADYALGERTLSMGLYGNDVDDLIQLLAKAGYAPDSVKFEKINGYSIFTEDIQTAVKIFQAYNNIQPVGIVDKKTLSKLKKKGR
jgi:murein L,D-transpeptidase YcbB/YkuD